jgi:hypothetical protein
MIMIELYKHNQIFRFAINFLLGFLSAAVIYSIINNL